MQGFLGVIVLVGIVVNNAIVLVDYTNQLRRDHGYSILDAVMTAGSRQLRPILMTTITTVLGLLPMAIGIGEGFRTPGADGSGGYWWFADIDDDYTGFHPNDLCDS